MGDDGSNDHGSNDRSSTTVHLSIPPSPLPTKGVLLRSHMHHGGCGLCVHVGRHLHHFRAACRHQFPRCTGRKAKRWRSCVQTGVRAIPAGLSVCRLGVVGRCVCVRVRLGVCNESDERWEGVDVILTLRWCVIGWSDVFGKTRARLSVAVWIWLDG